MAPKNKSINHGLLNIRFLSFLLVNYLIVGHYIDLVCFREKWLQQDEYVSKTSLNHTDGNFSPGQFSFIYRAPNNQKAS